MICSYVAAITSWPVLAAVFRHNKGFNVLLFNSIF